MRFPRLVRAMVTPLLVQLCVMTVERPTAISSASRSVLVLVHVNIIRALLNTIIE